MTNLSALTVFWACLGLIAIVSFGSVSLLAFLLVQNRNQLDTWLHLMNKDRLELLERFNRERNELIAYGLAERAELLNRLMTKTWEQFAQVQAATQSEPERFDQDPIAPEERMEFDASLGEVIVDYDNDSGTA